MLAEIGGLVTLVTVIVEVLKQMLPKAVPTKIVTIVVSLIVCIAVLFVSGTIEPAQVIGAIFGSFVVAFISMNGYDSLKSICDRFKTQEIDTKEDDK